MYGGTFAVKIRYVAGEKTVCEEVCRIRISVRPGGYLKVDKRHLVTVGLVDWSLDRNRLTSGFVPEKVTDRLDFVSVHTNPEAGKFDEAGKPLKGFSVGKPGIVEVTFPLKCSPKQLDEFIEKSGKDAAGWVSFYWGKPPEEFRRSKEIGDAILLQWLELFEKRAKAIRK